MWSDLYCYQTFEVLDGIDLGNKGIVKYGFIIYLKYIFTQKKLRQPTHF